MGWPSPIRSFAWQKSLHQDVDAHVWTTFKREQIGSCSLSRQAGMNAKPFRDLSKLLVPCPEESSRTDQHRSDQVHVGYSDSQTVQAPDFNQRAYFFQLRHPHLREEIE